MSETIGDYRVGRDFNPSGNAAVDRIKSATAALIDYCYDISVDANEEGMRCAMIAQDHYETAAMWAVKAATKRNKK